MAATATEQVIHNGSRNLVLKYTIAGTTGDIVSAKLVDRSSLSVTEDLRLERVSWALTGHSLNLLWDASDNVVLFECAAGEGSQCFEDVGGIPNDAGAGKTGDVVFTTTGYEASGEGGHVVLEFKKKNTFAFTAPAEAPGVGSLALTGLAPNTLDPSLEAGSLGITGAAPTVA